MFSEVLGLVITVLLLYLLLPRYGIMGAGIASLAAYGGVMLASQFFVWKAAFGRHSADSLADGRVL
jgi:O-antigen/teichoic acid export membrane protein